MRGVAERLADRYVLKTKVVATALKAAKAQSHRPQASTVPRVALAPGVATAPGAGGTWPVTPDKLAGLRRAGQGLAWSGRARPQVAQHGQNPPVAGVARYRPSLAKIELMCLLTALSVMTRVAPISVLDRP